MADPIKIDGLDVFVRNLKTLDAELPKTVRTAMNAAAGVVVDYARPRIPKRSGRAARSLRVASTQKAAKVRAGGARAPYFPWLDFGGRVGRRKSVARPFRKDGRYIYAGYFTKQAEFRELLEGGVLDTVRAAGIEVD